MRNTPPAKRIHFKIPLLMLLFLFGLVVFRRAQSVPSSPAETSLPDKTVSAHPEILLVNADFPLDESDQASDLINLYAQKDRHFSLMRSDMMLSREVFTAMRKMFAAANDAGMDGFLLTSAFRDRARQAELYAQTTDGTAAAPGHSEHETGLAFDVAIAGVADFSTTPQYAWLRAHCAEYGFSCAIPRIKPPSPASPSNHGITAMWASTPPLRS